MAISPAEFLAGELRQARLDAGLTQESLGERIHFSPQKVSAVETGRAPLNGDYVALVDEALDQRGRLVRLWRALVKDAAAPSWLREWIEIEQQAVSLRWYELAWVPGVLQTEPYARAVYESNERLNADEVEAKLTRRLSRQQLLAGEKAPRLVAVVDETTLRRRVGGRDVMREQLDHLAKVNVEQRRVRIQVVPASVGCYSGLNGPLVIATLADGEEVCFLENRLRGQVADRPADVVRVREQWEDIVAEALTPEQSTELILDVAKTWI